MNRVALGNLPVVVLADTPIKKTAPRCDVHVHVVNSGPEHQGHPGFGQGLVARKLNRARTHAVPRSRGMGVDTALYGGVYKSVCTADHPSGFDLCVGRVAGSEL